MFEVLLESSIRFGDKPLIELGFADTRFIAGNQENATALRVERESNAPDTAIRPETKFLHIGETGTFQRVHIGPPDRGTALPQRHEHGK